MNLEENIDSDVHEDWEKKGACLTHSFWETEKINEILGQ
jgi:hypothetical protein